MIRFSAALVAVAIGVLIGGIATSKLVLVYIAIVVSAAALVALATGVVLKREELFGEGQGPVPAGAGASPVLSARAGGGQDRTRPNASVAPLPPLQEAAAGYDAPVEPIHTPVSPVPVSPWETKTTGDPWSSGWQSTAQADPTPRGWGVPHPGEPGYGSARQPVPEREPAGAVPSWFAPTSTSTAGSGNGWSWPGQDTAVPGDTVVTGDTAVPSPTATPTGTSESSDEDDDWPTRYSWLDDEANEAEEPGESGYGNAAPGNSSTVPAAERAPATAGESAAAGTRAGSADDDAGAANDATVRDADADVLDDPGDMDQEPADPATEVADEAEGEPPAGQAVDSAPGTSLVTVIRGVPRYHEPDCVLIRFMPDGDNQKLTIPQAKANGCTPCTACQPPG